MEIYGNRITGYNQEFYSALIEKQSKVNENFSSGSFEGKESLGACKGIEKKIKYNRVQKK